VCNCLRLKLVTGLLSLAAMPLLADDLEGLVDPTAPLNMSVTLVATDSGSAGFSLPQFENFRLDSVLIRNEDRIAVVNGQRVRTGDYVGSARVTAINQAGVMLDVNGAPRILELYGAPVKTLVAGEGQ